MYYPDLTLAKLNSGTCASFLCLTFQVHMYIIVSTYVLHMLF